MCSLRELLPAVQGIYQELDREELLKTSEMTVDEIGTFVGFTNRWTMLRAFKKFVGMTPQSYRTYSTV
ncbi:MAG: helix-turn-helix domain-containing protein, partial [Oscillospiraceae bacterium]|nr:helix-turn-helix domain-containing protein [Oscillospiraceae bacterium]